MLQLLMGRSGSGKTYAIMEELEQLARMEEPLPLILLVPEQFSFESERALLHRLGARLSGRVQVLSFTRLAETVFREIGGIAGKRMDDGIRTLLMSQALEACSQQLRLYQRHIADPEYIRSALAMLTECKQCAVSPDLLEKASDTLEDGTLKQKTRELSLIFSAFDALAYQAQLIDPQDDLTTLATRMSESHIADGAMVYVDAFKGFIPQELQILSVILRRAQKTTVALCSDTIDDVQKGFGRFSPVIRTAGRLLDIARQNNVPVAKIRYVTENQRTADPALRALEANCFLPCPSSLDQPVTSVEIVPCRDAAEESRWAARTIRRLLRENGGYSRDFAIVVRHLEDYQGLLDIALDQAQIPYYMDQREDILSQPLFTYLLSALRCVTQGWDTEEVLRLLKTGLSGFSTRSISLLENYVFQWRIRGRQWKEDWVWNPEGLTAENTPETSRTLAHLNRLRLRLVKPLIRLEKRLAGKITGRQFAEAVYRFLEDARIPRMVRFQAGRLDKAGEHALAERNARMWDVAMELLDKFALALGEVPLLPSRLTELTQLVVSLTDLGSIPQALDGVQIGSADRIRYANPRTVLILGANEGVFPAYPSGQGVFSETERKQLIAMGLPMADPADWQTAEERFFAYAALSAPSERLCISYRASDQGEAQLPSVLVETVRKILPQCPVRPPQEPDGSDAESPADAFERLAAKWQENSPAAAAFKTVFSQIPEYSARLEAMERSAANLPMRFENSRLSRAFFGDSLRLSASQVETYHRCRFAYFCQYGLRARPRRVAEMGGAEAGTLAHYVMEQLLPAYGQQGFASVTREQVQQDVPQVVERYAAEFMGGLENKSSRLSHLVSQLTKTCISLMWRVVRELSQSRFVPVDYELPIGKPDEKGNFIPPWVLTLADGSRIQVQGVVDRVDLYHTPEADYIRVVDYKTGQKEFKLSEVVEGLNIQMLLYILSIWQNGANRYGKVLPAGVLYLPAKLPVIRVSREASPEKMETERLLTMRMNGLVLDDPQVIKAMEADAAGLFIPAKLDKKTGQLAKSASVASLEQFGKLKLRIQKLLTAMAETLRKGDVAALPAGGTVDGCAYCDYRAVCGHEPDDPVRDIAKKDAAQVLKELEEPSEEE